MNTKTGLVILAAVLTSVTSACSPEPTKVETVTQASPTTATSSPAVNCKDPNLTQAEWVENCTSQQSMDPSAADSAFAENEPKTTKASVPFNYMGWQFTITEPDCSKSTIKAEYSEPVVAQGVWCIVTVKAKNISTGPATLSESVDFALFDTKMTQYGHDFDANMALNDEPGAKVNPGGVYTAKLGFDVPKSAKTKAVQVTNTDQTDAGYVVEF